MTGLVDLDELVLRCRDQNAGRLISDAVSCYRAGAFKPSIVATWVAVVYDLLSKLNEMALTGDAQARDLVTEFEVARSNSDYHKLLSFERDILTRVAMPFELISEVERTDLERLRDDRNRCAHPSMSHSGEPFEPVAELARYHIHSAVTSLLALPPVQGKRAKSVIYEKIESELFPTNKLQAIAQLRSSPMLRPRDSLVSEIVQGLVVSIIKTEEDDSKRERQIAALCATIEMHRAPAESALSHRLNTLASSLEKEWFPRIVVLLGILPEAVSLLDEPGRTACETYLASLDGALNPNVLGAALRVPFLQKQARECLVKLDVEHLNAVIKATRPDPPTDLISLAIHHFAGSTSFAVARRTSELLIQPICGTLSTGNVKRILTAAMQNRQIYESTTMVETYSILLIYEDNHFDSLKSEWLALADKITSDSDPSESKLRFAEVIRRRASGEPPF